MPQIYKLTLSQLSGLLTDLQSDTVFGHLCWRMKEMYGDGMLKEFLDFYKNGNPVFSITDNLFEKDDKVYFPKPLYTKPQEKEDIKLSKAEKLEKMCIFKARKEKHFIDIDTLNLFLNGNFEEYEKSKDKADSIRSFDEYLRTNVQINRETFSAMEGRLFSYSPKYLNSELKKDEKPIKICFLIKVLDESSFKDFNCKELLKEVFIIGFGKKKSSGYGEFKIDDYNDYKEISEPTDSNAFLILSNYLPSKDDGVTNSYYDFHVKYGKRGEQLAQSDNPFKKPIIFFKPGSVFFTNKNKDFYGRCTNQGEISTSHKEVIQNGYSFSLRAKLKII